MNDVVMKDVFKDYKLRCELRDLDEDDVRRICVCKNDTIATSSKDSNIRIWSLDPHDARRYLRSNILSGHTNFVRALAPWISRNADYPKGRLVSGGMDSSIIVWNLANGEIVHTLKSYNMMEVTGLAVDGEDIVSSSADKNLRRWNNGRLIGYWPAHESPVEAVLKLPSGELVSGSTDQTLKLWKGQASLKTWTGHTGTVRGLAVGPNSGVFSASDDGSIIRWNRFGGIIKKMTGHTSAVYSVDFHEVHEPSSSLLVSGSEDHHAKIWNAKGLVQSLEHPGRVWDVKFLESGDIVTACSDGVARVWTQRDGMVADQTEIDYFETQLSESKRVKNEVAFFMDAENCPLPMHLIRIESFVARINMALRLENIDNELHAQHRYILGHPDLFTAHDRLYLEKQNFTFFDTPWRNKKCTFTYPDGIVCGKDVGKQRPEVRDIRYERKFDVSDTTMIELLLTRTRHPDCPKNVLLISSDRDFNMTTKYLHEEKGFTFFLAKNRTSEGFIFPGSLEDAGVRSTYLWEKMIYGGGLLTKVGRGKWKVEEGAFTRRD